MGMLQYFKKNRKSFLPLKTLNIKTTPSKVAQNVVVFNTANWQKTSPNLKFCSIEITHRSAYVKWLLVSHRHYHVAIWFQLADSSVLKSCPRFALCMVCCDVAFISAWRVASLYKRWETFTVKLASIILCPPRFSDLPPGPGILRHLITLPDMQ